MRHAIAIITLILPLASSHAGDWHRFRGPNGDGTCDEKLTLLDSPQRLWATVVGDGSASVIIHQNKAYTLGKQHLVCLDANSGDVLWRKMTDSWCSDTTPTYADGKLYIVRSFEVPDVQCREASDGGEVWTTKLTPPRGGQRHYNHAGSPVVWKDLVIVNVGQGAALKRDGGEIVWHHEGLGGLSTPVIFEHKGKPAVMIFGGKELFARDVRSGELLWSVPWRTNLAVNAADPIYHDGKVYICTSYGKYAAVYDVSGANATTGARELWMKEGSSFSSGFLREGDLYCFTGGHLSNLDFDTGEKRWSSPGVGAGSVLSTADKIILLSESGRLLIAPLSTQRFSPIIDTQVHNGTTWAVPSLSNGRLYVRNKEGTVVCVRIGKNQQ